MHLKKKGLIPSIGRAAHWGGYLYLPWGNPSGKTEPHAPDPYSHSCASTGGGMVWYLVKNADESIIMNAMRLPLN
jgi:hypothetical protein